MQIYLMRHAIAEDLGDGPWRRDAERPLTKEGIRRTRRAAEGLVSAGVAFDAILSSPLVRARETAEIVADVLEGSAPADRHGRAARARDGKAPHAPSRGGEDRDPAAVLEADALAPGLQLDELFRLVQRAAGRCKDEEARILLVGHEPDMGWLAAHLLGLPEGHSLPFKKGAVARIDVEKLPPTSPGRLVWMLTASLAGKLGS